MHTTSILQSITSKLQRQVNSIHRRVNQTSVTPSVKPRHRAHKAAAHSIDGYRSDTLKSTHKTQSSRRKPNSTNNQSIDIHQLQSVTQLNNSNTDTTESLDSSTVINDTDTTTSHWSTIYPYTVDSKLNELEYNVSDDRVIDLSSMKDVEWDICDDIQQYSVAVALLGTPNAGKSILVNALVRDHISAVSPKRNTTRYTITGVATHDNTQMIVYDTPGINALKNSKLYQRELSVSAWTALPSADITILLIDAAKSLTEAELELIQRAKQYAEQHNGMKLVLVLNKVDLVFPKSKLLDLCDRLTPLAPFAEVFMISAAQNDGVSDVQEFLMNHAVPREWEYDNNQVSDQTQLERVEQIIRQHVFERVHQELPYSVQQQTTRVIKLGEHQQAVRIDHALIVQQESHKPILIGHNGEVVRYIIAKSKDALERLFGCPVFLYLQVISSKHSNVEQQ